MPEFVVVWANKKGINPGDDYAPLDIQNHPNGGYFWYEKYCDAAESQRTLEPKPRFWSKEEGITTAERLVVASSLEELKQKVAAMHDWN
jgi:hypothetical protein